MKNNFFLYIILLFASQSSFTQNVTIDSLKRVLTHAKIDTTKVNLYNEIANEFKNSNPDSTAVYGQKAMVLSQKNHYDFGQANALINIGNAHIILSNYGQAEKDFQNAAKIYLKLIENEPSNQNKNGLARCFASLGVVFSEQNDYSKSLENYQKGLKLYQELEQKQAVSKILNNIGVVYKSMQNNKKALEFFEKALKIQQELGEQTVGVTLTNIGVIHFENGNNDKAISYYNQAEKEFIKVDNPRGYGLLNNYLGDYYKKQNDAEKAISYYNKSLKLYNEIDNQFGASLVLYNLGQLYFDAKKYNESLAFANKSLALAKEMQAIDQQIHSEKLMSDIYGKLNNPVLSLEYYKQFVSHKDSLNSEENRNKFLQAEANFEKENNEALQAETHKRKTQFWIFSILAGLLLLGLIFVIYNHFQTKKRLILEKEIAEYEQKALHLQMNPHFVFNCLGSISSFIVQNGTDSALKYLNKFSKLMRLTLEYSKNSLIPIDKEVESLQNYLELEQLRFNKKFDFKITTNPDIEDDMALPPLLVQPFVENAILHGLVPKAANGNLSVDFKLENNQLICTIIDDGIGMTKSKEMKQNQVVAHQSMALEITKKRLEMMEGDASVSITDGISGGTEVVLRLPMQFAVVR